MLHCTTNTNLSSRFGIDFEVQTWKFKEKNESKLLYTVLEIAGHQVTYESLDIQ